MALRYGSKSASFARYSKFVASVLRYGSKTAWTSGGGVDFSKPTPDSYFTFTLLDNDTYSIAATDISAMPETMILPSTYNGKAVTEVADDGFVGNAESLEDVPNIKVICIPASITRIGMYAFNNLVNVENVVLEKDSNLTSIGLNAFQFCGMYVIGTAIYGILHINLEVATKLTKIGRQAFDYSGLCEITIPNSVTSIEDNAFGYCYGLTDITIPDSVTSLGYRAFASCGSLTSVTIGNGITSIGGSAFYSCKSLTSIVIPDNVTSIGDYPFDMCSNLTIYCEAASQPSGWSSKWNYYNRPVVWGYTCHKEGHNYTVSDVVEPDCTGGGWTNHTCSKCGHSYADNHTAPLGHIETDWIIDTEATPTSTGSRHKECTRCGQTITTETIPIITTSDDYFTFTEQTDGTYSVKAKSTSNLPDYVVIPNTYNGKAVTKIADLAFSGATMSKLYIHEGITSIGYASFNGCSNLVEANLPASVTSIGEQAFNGCSSLATFTIADNSQLTSIGEYAFNYCSALADIGIPDTVTTIGAYAFRNCENLTIYCEVELVYKPNGWATTWAGGCSVIWGHTLLGDNYLTFTKQADDTYSVKAKNVNNMPSKVALPSIYNGKAVTFIEYEAFYNCSSLTSIVIPDSVTSIGSWAFRGCSSLTSIVIPESVTSIDGYAFYNCSSLTSVVIPDSVTSIGNDAFLGCSGLTSVVIGDNVTSIGGYAFQGCSSLTNIIIPDSVETIGSCAIRRCSSLTSVVIGDSVETIGSSAFEDCTALTSIVIPANVTTIDDYVFRRCDNLTIYCEAASQPEGWCDNWNYSNCPVVWDYTG